MTWTADYHNCHYIKQGAQKKSIISALFYFCMSVGSALNHNWAIWKYLIVEYSHKELYFTFQSGAQKEEESWPKKGAAGEREAEKKAEEAGEGSARVHPDRRLHYSSQMFGRDQVQLISLLYTLSFGSNQVRFALRYCLPPCTAGCAGIQSWTRQLYSIFFLLSANALKKQNIVAFVASWRCRSSELLNLLKMH